MAGEVSAAGAAKVYYKVLNAAGKSCHGGDMEWSLPTADGPGEWHEVAGQPVLCRSGLHVTEDPVCWFQLGYRVFAVEVGGRTAGPDPTASDDPTKVAVERCRLVRELDAAGLAAVGIYANGVYTARPGKSLALASSQVTARGNSQVTARGNSQVTAWGNSQVTARDSSQVTARDSSQVTARDSSQVTARDSSQVTAWDNSQVTARDNSQVTARGNSTVINRQWSGKGSVSLSESAVEIDWRSGKAEFRRAEPPTPTDAPKS